MRTLLGTAAYSPHVQHVARALAEAGWLARYETGALDVWRSPLARGLRHRVGAQFPAVDRELSRRRVTEAPPESVYPHWGWDLARVAITRAGLSRRIEDWVWERSEHALGRRFARLMRDEQHEAFIGVEHGALEALQACREEGKPSVVMFLSPHHATLDQWLEPEYEAFPELLSPAAREIQSLQPERNARKDREMRLATVIRANSGLTARSLVAAGVDPDRVFTVPLGCPLPLDEVSTPPPGPVRIIYAGPLSVRKGFHYLLAAWRSLRPAGVELHAYGAPLLPEHLLSDLPRGVVLHGSVPRAELMAAYEKAHLLVFPTLCDGFGMVASEALSRGVPVLTTPNAGAADLIREGENGFLVAPADARSLADRLESCIEDPTRLVEMRPAALETARSWTWAHFRQSFVQKLSAHMGVSAMPPGAST